MWPVAFGKYTIFHKKITLKPVKICPNLGPKLNVKIGSDKTFKKNVELTNTAPGRTARGGNKGGGLYTCYLLQGIPGSESTRPDPRNTGGLRISDKN